MDLLTNHKTDESNIYTGLCAKNICKDINERPIVSDVSLNLQAGEAVGLLGPNGAGKTTCFSMIVGFVSPTSGKIMLNNHDISHLPMYRRARLGIGYLPQDSSVFRGLNVQDNILGVLEFVEPSKIRRQEKLEQLLGEFSISHLARTNTLALSGGERRRVEIARALVTSPTFLMLDEPFAGIDPIATGEIRDLIVKLKKKGIGVLITDHNVRETLSIVDRAYILHNGKILMAGTPDHIISNDDVRRVYLGDRFSID